MIFRVCADDDPPAFSAVVWWCFLFCMDFAASRLPRSLLTERERETVRLFIETSSGRLYQSANLPFELTSACLSYRPVCRLLGVAGEEPLLVTTEFLDGVASRFHQEHLNLQCWSQGEEGRAAGRGGDNARDE